MMKRCPLCQRMYAEDSLMYCLDDGSNLLPFTPPGLFDPPPTLRIPEARVTDQPQPPAMTPPVYGQPIASQPFKVTNKMLGIAGASLLIAGIFMPLVSFMGVFGFNYMQIAQIRGEFFTAYVIPLLGGAALYLSLKYRYKPLIGIGILVIAILILDYFRIKSAVDSLMTNFPGAPSGARRDVMATEFIKSALQISWGFFVLVGAAVLLIVAGARPEKTAAGTTAWNRDVPPTILS